MVCGCKRKTRSIQPVLSIRATTLSARKLKMRVLGTRKVAIVGCGSIGSKIAVLLARAGVKDFVLVDDDLLLPENMIRHDLDWREIGTHKVESVARRIELVNPAARCKTRIHRLGGQESTGSFESMLTTLASCDLIVDATAEPRVFNVISAVVKTFQKGFSMGRDFRWRIWRADCAPSTRN